MFFLQAPLPNPQRSADKASRSFAPAQPHQRTGEFSCVKPRPRLAAASRSKMLEPDTAGDPNLTDPPRLAVAGIPKTGRCFGTSCFKKRHQAAFENSGSFALLRVSSQFCLAGSVSKEFKHGAMRGQPSGENHP